MIEGSAGTYYNNAHFYSRIFYYFNPSAQAKFLALQKTFKKYPLDKISWGIEWGCVLDDILNEPMDWFVHHQLVPLHSDLQKVFKSREYKKQVQKEIDSFKFSFDEDKYQACKNSYLDENLDKCI